jgi:hypothetical protein
VNRVSLRLLIGALATTLVDCQPTWPTDDQTPELPHVSFVEEPNFTLPEEAANWDHIGTYLIQSKGEECKIRLYVYDSDSVAEKRMAKKEFAPFWYPNSFTLHAFYLSGIGKWEHKELLSVGRVRFVKVGEVTHEKVELILRPNFMIPIISGQKARFDGEDVNKPFSKNVSLEDGVPVVH